MPCCNVPFFQLHEALAEFAELDAQHLAQETDQDDLDDDEDEGSEPDEIVDPYADTFVEPPWPTAAGHILVKSVLKAI